MLLGEAPALSLCVSVEASFASEPLAVVEDASPCEPATNSGVCDSNMAVCEAGLSGLLANGPSRVGDASLLPGSFPTGLPSLFDGASLCVPANEPGVWDSIAAVAEARPPASWPDAFSVAAEYESDDFWL